MVFGKITRAFTGSGSSGMSRGMGEMRSALKADMPILSGKGAMLSPTDKNYKGHFVDGDLILKAEENNLEDYALLAGEAKDYNAKATSDLRLAKDFYKNVTQGSDKRTKIVDLHTKAKAIVTTNHLRQFQSNAALKKVQMKTAVGYLGEKDKLQAEADKQQRKLDQFRSKVRSKQSQYAM